MYTYFGQESTIICPVGIIFKKKLNAKYNKYVILFMGSYQLSYFYDEIVKLHLLVSIWIVIHTLGMFFVSFVP